MALRKNSPTRKSPAGGIVITRIFAAPRPLVFAAWTKPEHLKQWSAPHGFTIPASKGELKPGGKWRACMVSPQGEKMWLSGVYREVVQDELLVFTHAWEGDGAGGHETLVTVRFEDHARGTKLTFEQSGFDSPESAAGHKGGWMQCFERLADLLPNLTGVQASRKLIMFNMATLDGYLADENGGIDWHVADEQFAEFAVEQAAKNMKQVDTILFGRKTYQLMAGYWPTEAARQGDPVVATFMNEKAKVVFSRTLKKAAWENTRLVKTNAVEVVRQLKQQPGKDLMIFGSGKLAATLTQHGLIDEYQVMVNPVVLGRGRPLFQDVKGRLALKLTGTRVFRSGNVLLSYQLQGKTS